VKRCGCGKRRYATKLDAMIALADIQRKDRPNAKECRPYPCPKGLGFHLTSHDRRRRR
jgi:hypothetical protein